MIKLKSKHGVIVDDENSSEAIEATHNIKKDGKSVFVYTHPDDEIDYSFPFSRNDKLPRTIIDEL